jgi:aspartokinase-like uncharacterized kinase
MSDSWVVVKVGGSLFDLPDLRRRLHSFLTRLEAPLVLLVPGGGMTADVIRELDRIHQLGDEAAHWLALRGMSVNANFLQELLPASPLIAEIPGPPRTPGWYILDAYPFFRADEGRQDRLPHGWHVTSDSLALRAAVLFSVRQLILLKSTDAPGPGQPLVDDYFTQALRQAPGDLHLRIVNLRQFVL